MSHRIDLGFLLPRLRANGGGFVLGNVGKDGRVTPTVMLHVRLAVRPTEELT